MTDSNSPETDFVQKSSKDLVLPCLREIRDLIDMLIKEIELGTDEVTIRYHAEVSSVRPRPPALCNCHEPLFFKTFLPSEIIERLAPILAGLFRGLGR